MADKLLSSFGHDILDALFITAAERQGALRVAAHFLFAVTYVTTFIINN